jgi:hypothetical protein
VAQSVVDNRQADKASLFMARSFVPYWQASPTIAAPPQKLSTNTSKENKPRPRMEGSYTGYIENAVVGNQIRVRFDAGFNEQDPDRAEFFYAKCGCFSGNKGPGPQPGIAARLNFQEVHLRVEYAPSEVFSFFGDVPERSVQFTSTIASSANPGSATLRNASGLGDFEAGVKIALIARPQTYLTFELAAFMPTGHSTLGLGTNHYSLQPMLLFNHKMTDRVTVSGQFGDRHPINGSPGPMPGFSSYAGDVLEYGLGGSYDFLAGSENHIAPVVEFVGWSVLSGFELLPAPAPGGTAVSASGTNIVNGKIGVRFSFRTHSSIYAGYGEALTNQRWYKELLRIEYRYAF